ncbi:GNAT family N-acetyltransferase [Nonomuraea sp. NEAU-A123]|uniref:GNAT family N-acetyltransferase n=1 Tax=Nonomuraea sp. NEAU-A123 TaxID=2839649 RepID=UPI001BE4764B|nr:GNAT family N-acetyltransferase [Nonomuraea sp. NEAU-A123]MBT2229910.1 GNAT family N-acetyltransferase [Nonomuraea sp. NEAU-A123]
MTLIQPLSEADLPAVAEIYAHYVMDSVATFDETPLDTEAWRLKAAAIAEVGLPFLVAKEGDRVLGFAYCGRYRPKPAYRHTVEDTIYLSPGATGRGLGRRLLAELISLASEAGARQMIAVIADGGDPASLKLHAAFGFAEAGRLKAVGFKHGRWIDTILYQLELA